MPKSTDSINRRVASAAPQKNETQPMEQYFRHHSRPYRCMVVDDNKVVLQFVARMLARLGYQVETAENKADVMSNLAASDTTSPYHLIVTDLEMPDMNGFHLAVTIKTVSRKSRVIIMTGRCRQDCMSMIETGWADGWIFKPFMLNELQHVLEGLSPVDNRHGAYPIT
jgi:DNA-binding response OmpR family regulator